MRSILTLTIALTSLSLLAGSAFAASAVYDPATGSISIDDLSGLSGDVGGIQLLTSDNGGSDPLVEGNADALGGLLSSTGDQQLNWLFLQAKTPADAPLSLGNVAPTGVLQSAIEANYFLGLVISGSGVADPRANPVPITGGLDVIPEPATMMLAGVCLVGCVATRRRS